MAGVTDLPFRTLCREFGAGLAVSEMLTSDVRLWNTQKSRLRLAHDGEREPRSVQIAGADPQMMAEAAAHNAERGAQIIDINMGCPAKKVCKKAAGSALMKDEALVRTILEAVVASVDVPVTLKIRTGWDLDHRNATSIARIAEDSGIQALAVHGRTRACAFKGEVEYDTIAKVKAAVDIPVFANGDIDSARKAAQVLAHTGADGVLIGRAAQGRPWIFSEINHFLETGKILAAPSEGEIASTLLRHIADLHRFYGEFMGVRIARKHVGWYLQTRPDSKEIRRRFNQLESGASQLLEIQHYFQQITSEKDQAA